MATLTCQICGETLILPSESTVVEEAATSTFAAAHSDHATFEVALRMEVTGESGSTADRYHPESVTR